MRPLRNYRRPALSLLELLAVVAVLGGLAAIIVPRITVTNGTARHTACEHNCKHINVAVDRYMLDNDGALPTSLSDINTVYYFPDGIPTCPVSGSAYTLNSTTGRVDNHPGAHP